MGAAELALRLRVERLIAGFPRLGLVEAMAALADVEAVAEALVAVGVMDAEEALGLVGSTVDALAVRGASWVEPMAVDLDVRRLYDLAAGSPRPRLRRVVPVGSGGLTTVELWDDRVEARVVADHGAVAPSIHLDAVPGDTDRLELGDGTGAVVTVELSPGRTASEGGSTRRLDAAEYLSRIETDAVAAAWRDPSVDNLNAQRRRTGVVAEALADDAPAAVARFDAAVSVLDGDARAAPALVELVPIAVRSGFGWLLSLERWSDHWRAVVRAEGRGRWAASDDRGNGFGGEVVAGDVIRFDPALSPTWSWVTLSRLGPDGTVVEVDVVRP